MSGILIVCALGDHVVSGSRQLVVQVSVRLLVTVMRFAYQWPFSGLRVAFFLCARDGNPLTL